MCRAWVLAILVLVTAAPAGAVSIPPTAFAPGATVVDFEDQMDTGLPTVPGMSFVFAGNFSGSTVFDTAMFGGAYMANHVSLTYTDLAVVFTTPVEGAGAWVSQIPNFTATFPSTLTVVARDALGGVLDEATVPLPAIDADPVFVGFGSATGIARLEWRVDNQGFFGVDDIMFGALLPVPEPARLALVAAGLALLARRKV